MRDTTPTNPVKEEIIARTCRITGTVQGVGFRPFVFRLAHTCAVSGSVVNTGDGVVVKAQARKRVLDRFFLLLQEKSPPLARIRSMQVNDSRPDPGCTGFSILPSQGSFAGEVDIPADTAVCEACLADMQDPYNRRHDHAFISCTDCGPRYTIIKGLPYDRPVTTMRDFPLCPQCEKEYRDPADRRYHAQPICCPQCGPRLSFLSGSGEKECPDDPVALCRQLLAKGTIGAIKGIGGFHLACRADRNETVRTLRARKQRDQKPFALMVPDLATARRYVRLTDQEETLLQSIQRPVVLCGKRHDLQGIGDEVAPRLPTLGILLPCAPLHYLLFKEADYDALVMTSANRTHEPICMHIAEAVDRLKGIADWYLTHDRPIQTRCDDSVARVLAHAPVLLRRARGFAPEALATPHPVDGIVALGGIMKSTLALGQSRQAYVSQYLGVLDTPATLANAHDVLQHLCTLLDIHPSCYVVDLHPGGLSPPQKDVTCVQVPHHHAHAAACMGENRVTGPCICVVYDGLGLGPDKTIWGGEILVADYTQFTRVGHLRPMPMPGGDAATLFPGRMALGALSTQPDVDLEAVCPWMDAAEKSAVLELLRSRTNTPLTSSMGRLFDACAALLDVCRRQTFEGQPAMELEGAAAPGLFSPVEPLLQSEGDTIVMDGGAVLARIWREYVRGMPKARAAAVFHASIVEMTVAAVKWVARQTGITRVALSGGCFLNALLAEGVVERLLQSNLTPLKHRILSPGDECIAYGQLLVAASRQQAKP